MQRREMRGACRTGFGFGSVKREDPGSDPMLAATKTQVTDKRFLKAHKNYSVTPDENALAEWVRKNIAPRDASVDGNR